ncbi:putative ribonucleoprotein [Operophtera brumata]|uniref:Putative ribonucleoprotein n=1 Tax=Operophtera brumata TaxID=104452 RepID=A0A0L7LK66_OPEBR|nr:putative ribonucleoprotein [Operophtera brumata]
MSTDPAVDDPKLDPKIRNLITRFIHVGKEKPKYYPGCWTAHEYFEPERLVALDKAFEESNENCLEAINLLLKVGKEGWYTRFETIAFALAKCLLLTNEDFQLIEQQMNSRDAIIKYVINGLKRTKSLCGAKEGTKEVLELIQKVEDMRHCEDPVAAAAIASRNQFTLDHVPAHLLTSQDNLQRIHNMGFLTVDSTTTAILISLINNQDFINKSEVTPIEVYITLNNYKNKTKPIAHAKATVMADKETRRRARQIFDPKTGLWEWSSLLQAIQVKPGKKTVEILPKPVLPPAPAVTATGDAEPEKKSKKKLLAQCFYHTSVTPGHVAIIMALQILKREKNAKLAVFTEEGIQLVSLEPNFINIDEAEFKLRNNHKFDVFINIIDRSTRYLELDHDARGGRGNGARYGPPPTEKKGVTLPDRCPTSDDTHCGVLDVVGIDEHVPKLIDAFALGQFK